ncbi:hypothetical protein KKG05_04640 [bacterium]|nr:hypothetical protein [bacterium]
MNEAQTRATVIDPILEALGWDVRDPDEVQMEYPTVDGKAVDYGLRINRKTVLLVEAKALGDPLTDVKAITQIVGYAANDGISSCILTNGVKWCVYRSMEKCPAPEKLMFEVSIDPRDSEGLSIQQLGEKMWQFSREKMAEGTLDQLGEQTFTDGKVRKAMDEIMRDTPLPLMRIVKKVVDDEALTPQKIKESLARIWVGSTIISNREVSTRKERYPQAQKRSEDTEKVWTTRRTSGKKGTEYDESIHTSGKPKEVLEIFRAIERYCFSLAPDIVEKQCLRRYINFRYGKEIFCSIVIWQNKLGVYLKLKHGRLSNTPKFARNVSNVGHWGIGDLELAINSLSQLEATTELIRKSFESIA